MIERDKLKVVIELGVFTLILMLIFRLLPYGDTLKIQDYFQFGGSLFGAVIGALVSFEILNITITKQREDFEIQRKMDNDKWESTNKQINKELQIKAINEKISDYKACIEKMQEFIKTCNEFAIFLLGYHDIVNKFERELSSKYEYIYEDQSQMQSKQKIIKLGENKEKTELNLFNLLEVNNKYNYLLETYEKVSTECMCILEKETVHLRNRTFNIFILTRKEMDEFIALNMIYDSKAEYFNYFIDNNCLFNQVMDDKEKRSENIIKFQKDICEVGRDLAKIIEKIMNQIESLYTIKYNLYNPDTES